jgi:hypothetical protein
MDGALSRDAQNIASSGSLYAGNPNVRCCGRTRRGRSRETPGTGAQKEGQNESWETLTKCLEILDLS